MCVAHTHECRSALTQCIGNAREEHQVTIFVIHWLIVTEPGTHWSRWVGQTAFKTHLSPSLNAGVAGMCNRVWTFSHGLQKLEFRSSDLQLKHCDPLSNLPNLRIIFLSSVMALYADVKWTSIKDFRCLIEIEESNTTLWPIQRQVKKQPYF